MTPRRHKINPREDEYNRVIRLEGQVHIAAQIIRFRSQYRKITQDAEGSLEVACDRYLRSIDNLISRFVDRNLDLASVPTNGDDLVRLVEQNDPSYFLGSSSEEGDAATPKLLWYQRFQMILENENISVQEALVEGWRYCMDPERWLAKIPSTQADEYSALWHELGADRQAHFLKKFEINSTDIQSWPNKAQELDMPDKSKVDAERDGLCNSLRNAGIKLDVHHPQISKPELRDDYTCSICLKNLVGHEIDSSADHRPVQTTCHHVFGYSCLRDWFNSSNWNCPLCREDLLFNQIHDSSPEDILQSCNRALEWTTAPSSFYIPQTPHSHVDKLAMLFRPANEIRLKMPMVHFSNPKASREEDLFYKRLVFLARDRMEAVLEGNVQRFQEVVQIQVQSFARHMWWYFWVWTHPRSTFMMPDSEGLALTDSLLDLAELDIE